MTFVTKNHLSRRALLRGVGASLALPLLDSMRPAFSAEIPAVTRLGFVYVPHGAVMQRFTPTTVGANFEFTPILKPLEAFRDHVAVISGLDNKMADNAGVHSLGPPTWLSGVRPAEKEGDIRAGITADQIAAARLGQSTQFPSLELATEDHSNLIGACDGGYSCTYINTISWRTPTTPLPMEINPRAVFERLFGEGGTVAQRMARQQQDRSILDAISGQATRMKMQLPAMDRSSMDQYLENVREIERRIALAEKQSRLAIETPAAPAGVPDTFDEHVKLMFDLQALAWQADITRVSTFMMARELSQRTYPQVGAPDPHHSISHHEDRAEKLDALARIQNYHVTMFSYYLNKLRSTPDGDGTLLDHSLLLYGSNMSNSNLHNHFPLPVVVAGGASGKFRGNRHLKYADRTPMANLLMTMLHTLDLVEITELLLSGSVTPNASAPLVLAAHNNDLAGVQRLLASRADVKATNTYGVTALLEAASNGNAAIVEKLLAAGADANAASLEGETPLMAASRAGDAAVVKTLLKQGAVVDAKEAWKGQTALMWAAAANRSEAAIELVHAGADVNVRSTAWTIKPKKNEGGNLVSNQPRGGLTPLLYAARQGSLAAAKVLVEAGANLNLTEPDGISPLVMATINAHYDLAAYLLDAGADPNIADKWGRAALYAALDMQTLEPSVTRPAPRTSDMHTGLDVARLALTHGAKVDATLSGPVPGRGVSDNADPILRAGATPFIRAAKTGDVEGMRLLLEHGADAKAATALQVTALMAAAGLGWRYGDSEISEQDGLEAVKICLELGLDPNLVDAKGRSALHGAAERGGNAIAEYLVAHGADLNLKDNTGLTPVDVAKGNGGRGNPEYPQTVALLTKLAAQAKPQ